MPRWWRWRAGLSRAAGAPLWLIAAAALVALASVLWSSLRHERTPQSFVEAGGSTGIQSRMWTRGEAVSHPAFWLMVPALMGPAAWNTAFFFQQVRVAEAKGWAHVTLVYASALHREQRGLHAVRWLACRPDISSATGCR